MLYDRSREKDMPKKPVRRKKPARSHLAHHHHHASNNFVIVVAGGFIVLVVLMYLVASTNYMQKDAAVPVSEATQSSNAKEVTVTVENGVFTPATVTIKKGESVTFVNNDVEVHTATAKDGSFTTQNLGQDTSEKITFDTPGVYNYSCTLHPDMQGVVIVEE